MNTRYNIQEMGDEDFIGMQKEAANALCEKRGLRFRVTSEDGEFFAVTMDYRTDRVNVSIEKNVVLGCNRG